MIGDTEGGNPLLSRIQRTFREWGVFRERISVEHEGSLYRVWCDEGGFMVYRVNEHQGIPPGIPGWSVCWVDAYGAFEDCCSDTQKEEPTMCPLTVSEWLDLVDAHRLRKYLPDPGV